MRTEDLLIMFIRGITHEEEKEVFDFVANRFKNRFIPLQLEYCLPHLIEKFSKPSLYKKYIRK